MIESVLGREADFRRAAFRVVLLVTAAAVSFFAVFNWVIGHTWFAIVEFAVVAGWLWLFRVARGAEDIIPLALIYLVSSFGLVAAGLYLTKLGSGLFAWVFIFPVLSYLLLGPRLGLCVMVVILLVSLSLLAWLIDHQPEIPWIAFANGGLCLVAIWALAHTYEAKRARVFDNLRGIATRDVLTGLYNRLLLPTAFKKVARKSREKGSACALMIVDIDHFKRVNDTYGHEAGDQVLASVAKLLNGQVRSHEWLFRIGGEEFCLVLPETGDLRAFERAEAIRQVVEQAVDEENKNPAVTVSIGVAAYPADGNTLSEMLSAADKRLYRAKEAGRNRVVSGGSGGEVTRPAN